MGLLAAGCETEVYDSSVTETASLRLTVEWERQDAAVPLPAAYTALLPDSAPRTLAGDEPRMEALPTGATRLMLFNLPAGMTARGSVLSVTPGSVDIGWLFTAAQDIYVKPLTDNLFSLRMKQRTRELHFRADAPQGTVAVRAELEAASKLDVEYNRLFDPAPVCTQLAPDGAASFAGSARILGIAGASLDIRFTFEYADAEPRCYLLSVPADAFGADRRLPSPLRIELLADAERCRARIGSDSGSWQVELSRIEIDNNDPSADLSTENQPSNNLR